MSKVSIDLSDFSAILFDVDGVLSLPTISTDLDGNPLRTVNVRDGYAIMQASKSGLVLGIITGGGSPLIPKRYNQLGLQHIYMRSRQKMNDLNDFCQKTGITPERIIYCGDDIPDLPVMKAVGFAVAPNDAATEILAIADYISPVSGGQGVARDIIEEVLRAKGKWLSDESAFGW